MTPYEQIKAEVVKCCPEIREETTEEKVDRYVSEYIERAFNVLTTNKIATSHDLGDNAVLEVAKMIQIEDLNMINNISTE